MVQTSDRKFLLYLCLNSIFVFSKSGDGKSTRFDKPLEEFFSICNQIELHLKTIGESVIQQRDGQKYVQCNVNLKSDPGIESLPDNSITYRLDLIFVRVIVVTTLFS